MVEYGVSVLAGGGEPSARRGPANVEGFESGRLEEGWVTSETSCWKVVSTHPHEGAYCARSGAIGNGQSTSLMWAVDGCAKGEIIFYRRVSSLRAFDTLRFCIDSQEQARWSGDLPWDLVRFPITPGTHTFKWEYAKSSSIAHGEDAAWIDDVEIIAE